jgi:anti-sigma regulatory factor (Ser/Thr protein kinase)
MRREFNLPVNETAATLARSSLSGAIPPPDLFERGEDARLAVSELAANAIRHGNLRPDRDTLRLVIETDEHHLRVEVEQPTPAPDVHIVTPRPDAPAPVGGFGLRIVEGTADRWGHESGPPGRVWFEFLRGPASSEDTGGG